MVIPNALNAAMGAMHITKIKNFLNHKDKDFLRNILGRYDRDNNNQLDLKEVRAILRELNEGEEVEDELVHWVMEQADRDRSGMIGRHEILALIESWLMLTDASNENLEDVVVSDKDVTNAMDQLLHNQASHKHHHHNKESAEEQERRREVLEMRLEEITSDNGANRKSGPEEEGTSTAVVKTSSGRVNKGVAFQLHPSGKAESVKKPAPVPSRFAEEAAKDDEDVEGEDSGSEEDMSPRAVQLGLSQPDYRFIRQLMKKYDFSDNNFMEIREAAHFLQDLNKGEPLNKDAIRDTFQRHDKDGDGRLSMAEVLDMVETWYQEQPVAVDEEVDYSLLKKCTIM